MTEFLQFLFEWSEVIGCIAFAASGAMLAIDRELDLFGVLVLGAVTAVGGGITRDVLLGVFPPNAFRDPVYVCVALATALVVFLFAFFRGSRYWNRTNKIDRIINWLDAIGLGIFSVVGAKMAREQGFADNAFLCIFMGMITGVGGGMLRDILSLTVPAVLKKRIYAVASILGACAYYFSVRKGLDEPAAMLAGMLLTIVVRMLATRFEWNLPMVRKN